MSSRLGTGGSEFRSLSVPDGLAGERVDAALARLFGFSRSRAAELIAAGHVTLDGGPTAKSDRVSPGAQLDVEIPALVDAVAVVPETVEGISIIHDDDMVIAKSEHSYSVLKNAFRRRTVDKTYHALVQGHPDPLRGTVDAPIGRHPRYDYKFAVMAGGRESVTHYETLEAHRFASLLEIHLETGRTHQIRVHMAALKHPCVGDITYGADPVLARRLGLERQWLHAVRLGFEHPDSGEYVEFESPYPADLQHALDLIRDEL